MEPVRVGHRQRGYPPSRGRCSASRPASRASIALCTRDIRRLSLGFRLGPVADVEGVQPWGRSSPSDVRLSAIGCLHNGRPLQMRHPRAVPAIPPRFCRLGRRRAPLPGNFTFDRQTQHDGQFSAILRCPVSGCARAVCPRQVLIPRHGRRHRSQFRCQTINFVSHPTELVQHVALDRIRHVFDENLAPQRPAAGLQPSRGAGLSPIMVSLRPAPVAFAHRIRLREVDNRGQCRCRPSWRYEPITPTA